MSPDPAPAQDGRPRLLTCRSLGFGLLGLVLIAVGAGYQHTVLGSASRLWMISNHLPPVVFAYLMLIGLLWNGLTARFVPRWTLSSGELAIVMLFAFVACFPASAGLTRYLLRNLALPWHYLPGQPEWVRHGLLEQHLDPALFPRPAPFRDAAGVLVLDQRVYGGFFTGLAVGGRWVGPLAVPWRAWLPALAQWLPLVGALSLAVIAMALVVHRQWSRNEQLPYPLAQVAAGFWLRADGRRGVPDLFRRRLFWIGFMPLFSLYLLDYLAGWFPGSLPRLDEMLPNLKGWTLPLAEHFPVLRNAPRSGYLSWQRISFSIVGLAYFASSEISLTMGLAPLLLTLTGLLFWNATGAPIDHAELDAGRAGAYIGYALVLLYTGRRHYRGLFVQAFLRGRRDPEDDVGVLAARVFVVAFLAFVALLVRMGSSPPMALCYGLGLMMLFLVFTRVICETGIPFLQANWTVSTLLVSIFGPAAVGPRTLTLLSWTNSLVAQDPRECLMPYVATSVRMSERIDANLRTVFKLLVAGVAIAVLVAVAGQLWVLYNHGPLHDVYAGQVVPRQPFNEVARWLNRLLTTGEYEASLAATGAGRLRLIDPDRTHLRFLGAGAAMVGLFAAIRFRFTRFPLHPVLFVAWGTWATDISWGAYLLGWFVKTLVVRFGGGRAYQRFKPLFIGLIASELIAISAVILIDLAHYWRTGHPSGVQVTIQVN